MASLIGCYLRFFLGGRYFFCLWEVIFLLGSFFKKKKRNWKVFVFGRYFFIFIFLSIWILGFLHKEMNWYNFPPSSKCFAKGR